MQKYYMRIDGIFCDHCKKMLTEVLLKDPAIRKVKIQNGVAHLTCASKPNFQARIKAVNELGYVTKRNTSTPASARCGGQLGCRNFWVSWRSFFCSYGAPGKYSA